MAGSSSEGDAGHAGALPPASTPLRGRVSAATRGPPFSTSPKAGRQPNVHLTPGRSAVPAARPPSRIPLGAVRCMPGERGGNESHLPRLCFPGERHWEKKGEGGGKKGEEKKKHLCVSCTSTEQTALTPPASSHLPEPPRAACLQGAPPCPLAGPRRALATPPAAGDTVCSHRTEPQGLNPCSPPACIFLKAPSCPRCRAEPATGSCTGMGQRWARTRPHLPRAPEGCSGC